MNRNITALREIEFSTLFTHVEFNQDLLNAETKSPSLDLFISPSAAITKNFGGYNVFLLSLDLAQTEQTWCRESIGSLNIRLIEVMPLAHVSGYRRATTARSFDLIVTTCLLGRALALFPSMSQYSIVLTVRIQLSSKSSHVIRLGTIGTSIWERIFLSFPCRCVALYACRIAMSVSEEIHISYAELSDIPDMIKVHLDAFNLDDAVTLTYTRESHEQVLNLMLKTQIPSPKFLIAKATEQSTKEILGWQKCSLFGYHDMEDEKTSVDTEGVEQKTDLEQLLEKALPKDSSRRKLYEATHDDAARVRKDWMGDEKYIYLNTLVIHPDHQGHGIGSALLRWVIARTEADGVPCWLNSSPVAYSLYVKAGFKEVGFQDVDLREFVPKDMESQRQWGIYHCAYMLREPQHKSDRIPLDA